MSSPDLFDSSPPGIGSQLTIQGKSNDVSISSDEYCANLTPPSQSPVTVSPTPPSQFSSSGLTPLTIDNSKSVCSMVIVNFVDSEGNKLHSRSSNDPEVVSIITALVRSSNSKEFAKAAVNKICEANLFKDLVEEKVLKKISGQFQRFLKKEKCPLKIGDILESPDILVETDFEDILNECYEECPNLVNALCEICLSCSGYRNLMDNYKNKYQKQRLLAIIAIASFTRNQKINRYQKVIGEFLKRRNTSKHCLQYLHRVGLSLVTMSIRSDQTKMGSNFLQEVKMRKEEVEAWAWQKNILKRAVTKEVLLGHKANTTGSLKVQFINDSETETIKDIGAKVFHDDVELSGVHAEFLEDQLIAHGTATKALEFHLDSRPKLFDVTYDNIGNNLKFLSSLFIKFILLTDIGCLSNEYIVGDADKSKHWTSSIIVEGKQTPLRHIVTAQSQHQLNSTST